MERVRKFLQERWDRKSPLLLGYSGGFDSKALLYSLLECGVLPHLAHVDHGWREESRQEAEELKLEAEKLKLPFHTIRLDPDRREVIAREKRLEFFASLQRKIPFQALLLAHHADDWAETTLKRVLEGSHLVHLGGMKQIANRGDLILWRPLLDVPRKIILNYLQNQQLHPIQDPTNFDPAYLRARMRTQILPNLAKTFGKEISANLTLLGKRANELKDYLDRRTDDALKLLQRGPWGVYLPCSLEEPIELRHLLQKTEIPFTRSMLDELVTALLQREANRKIGRKIIADRGCFFYLSDKNPCFEKPVPIKKGIFTSGDWRIEIVSSEKGKQANCDWRNVWVGNFSFYVPEGNYQLKIPGDFSSLRKMLNERKVPAFLRPHLPHIYQEEKWAGDFLSGREMIGHSGYRVRFSLDSTASLLGK